MTRLAYLVLLTRWFIFVYAKVSSMTTLPTLSIVSLLSLASVADDGTLDVDASVEGFKAQLVAAWNSEQENQKTLFGLLNEHPEQYVDTGAVIQRIVSRQERAAGREFSPDESKAATGRLADSIDAMKASGVLHAKIGKGGGLQTMQNHSRLERIREEKEAAKKKRGSLE